MTHTDDKKPEALRIFDTKEKSCTSWCTDPGHTSHDPACWGYDHVVNLTLEEGYPAEALPEKINELDPPRVSASPYRLEPGYREVVYLHVRRASHIDHLDLDSSVHLTADEAVQFAHALLAAADYISPALEEPNVDTSRDW